ncbi:15917_t:CDS:2 [Funneliformis geosporum]|uniref:15917_t:CDS:1 n=1 Tax=Funneliformis geosporum TaxID=1117311 RepID=A0A9W4WUI8_9GLOM|nr:15917_t:CDS:2 [Funneliformis geosporum]
MVELKVKKELVDYSDDEVPGMFQLGNEKYFQVEKAKNTYAQNKFQKEGIKIIQNIPTNVAEEGLGGYSVPPIMSPHIQEYINELVNKE